MRLHLGPIFAVAALGILTVGAQAAPLHAPEGLSRALTQTSIVQQARTVCRRDPATNRRVCVIDRSQPPTVCHWVRDQNGNVVRDCY